MFEVALSPPVGLQQDAVDLLEVDGLGAVADGLHHGGEGEVSDASEDAFAGARDEVERLVGEGVMAESDFVELPEDEGDGVVGREPLQQDGVGDAAPEVVVHSQIQLGEQLWLGDEDEVVVLGEVLEDEPEAAQGVDFHEMRVIDDGREHLALLVDLVGLFDETRFALEVATLLRDVKRLTQDAQDGMVGVERAVDGGVRSIFGSCSRRACLMMLLPVPG